MTGPGHQNYGTPDWFYSQLKDDFGSRTVDVCAEPWSAREPRYWTKEQDGLAQDWEGERAFCNPPFTDPGAWLLKGLWAARKNSETDVLYILPAGTDTVWFHDIALLGHVYFPDRRVNFKIPPGYVPRIDKKTGLPKKPGGNNGPIVLVHFNEIALAEPGMFTYEVLGPKGKARKRLADQGRLV